MNPNMISFVLMGLIILLWILILYRFLKDRFSTVVSVPAVVVDAYRQPLDSGRYGALGREVFVVVFSAEGKRLSFSVSEFTFKSYHAGDTGILCYRGKKLIDFS